MRRKPRAAERTEILKAIRRFPARGFGRLITRELAGPERVPGVSILFERLPPRTSLPAIRHKRTAEWILCLKGRMTAHLDGRRRLVRKGMVLFLPAGMIHRFVTGSVACEAISVFSPPLRIGPEADLKIVDR